MGLSQGELFPGRERSMCKSPEARPGSCVYGKVKGPAQLERSGSSSSYAGRDDGRVVAGHRLGRAWLAVLCCCLL